MLETVPGLHVGRSDQAYMPKYIIRGITSAQNPQALMLINGVPVTSLFFGNRGQAWAGMPLKSVARIEVIRGPGSALYGADAYAGVINIQTKSSGDIYGTRAGLRSGSFNSHAAWLEHGGTYGDADIGFTLEATTTDGWNSVIDEDRQTQLDTPFGTHASQAPGPANTMKKMLEARLEIADGNNLLRAGYQGRYNIGAGPGLAQALDNHGRFASERINADYTYSLPHAVTNWNIDLRTSYYYGTQAVEEDVLVFPKGAFGGAFPDGFIGNPELKEENARVDLSGLFTGQANHRLRLGAGFFWGDIFEVTESKNFNPDGSPRAGGVADVSDTAETFLPEKGRTSAYLFTQDEWKLADHWQLTTGVRYDRFSDFGGTTNPRLALVWAASPGITTKLLFGRAFRAPSIAELYATSNPVNLGNPALQPERIDTLELGFSHQISGELLYTANVFHYTIKDYINFVSMAGSTRQAMNVGERRGNGLELEVDFTPAPQWRLLANYAYQRATDTQTGADVGEAPNHELYGRSEWEITPGWHIDSQLTWVGAQKRVLGDPRTAVAASTTLDVTVRKQVSNNTLGLALSLRNALDADVREPSPGPAAFIPHDFPMAGRSLYAEMNYRF